MPRNQKNGTGSAKKKDKRKKAKKAKRASYQLLESSSSASSSSSTPHPTAEEPKIAPEDITNSVPGNMSHGSFTNVEHPPPLPEDEIDDVTAQEINMKEFIALMKSMGVHVQTEVTVTYEPRTKENSAPRITSTVTAASSPAPDGPEATEAADAANAAQPAESAIPATNDDIRDAEANAEKENTKGPVHSGTGIGGMSIGG